MNELLDTIRTAIAADASAEAKQAGAAACRTLLAALEAKAGDPLVSASAPTASPIANAIAMLRGMPVDQVLDVAISRLRAAIPAGESAPSVLRLNVPIVAIPRAGGKR
jgi:hypothetical protein